MTILCKYGIIISDVTLCITPLHQELSTFWNGRLPKEVLSWQDLKMKVTVRVSGLIFRVIPGCLVSGVWLVRAWCTKWKMQSNALLTPLLATRSSALIRSLTMCFLLSLRRMWMLIRLWFISFTTELATPRRLLTSRRFSERQLIPSLSYMLAAISLLSSLMRRMVSMSGFGTWQAAGKPSHEKRKMYFLFPVRVFFFYLFYCK